MDHWGKKLSVGVWVFVLASFAVSATPQSTPSPAATAPATAQQQSPATSSATSSQSGGAEQKPADQGAGADSDTLTTLRTTTNEVNVLFTVTDKHGRRFTDL